MIVEVMNVIAAHVMKLLATSRSMAIGSGLISNKEITTVIADATTNRFFEDRHRQSCVTLVFARA
jgi:hypothetical protein